MTQRHGKSIQTIASLFIVSINKAKTSLHREMYYRIMNKKRNSLQAKKDGTKQ